MAIWFFRLLVIVALPTLYYLFIAASAKGILIGVAIAIAIIIAEIIIERVTLDSIIFALLGVAIGLSIAKLFVYMLSFINNDELIMFLDRYSLFIYIICGYLGLAIMVRKKDELNLLDQNIFSKDAGRKNQEMFIMDTCVLIDGRIADMAETKFLRGIAVIPRFVLQELQQLADSSDSQRRVRGRRGLEILSRFQGMKVVPVKIYDKDYPQIREVDAKIVQLAKDINARVLTTDFNLNKIASLQGVEALNINDLAAVLKPVVLPGETMTVYVLKEGKERNQGIAYLDDGTMVVVEEGRNSMGKRVEVTVTSILQTSSGRMIFAKMS